MSDVVIIGGGPVGLFMAALLLQRGVAVTVLEQRATPEPHSRAIGIHPPALEALGRIGVDQELVRRGVPIRRGLALSRGSTLAEMSFAGVSERFPFVLSLPQNATEAVLEERVRGLNPETLRRGVRVTGLHDDGAHVTVEACVDGAEEWISAPVVIAADGVRSAARANLGVPLRCRDYPDRYLMGDFADGTAFGPDAALFLAGDGIVESFPLPGQRRRWVVRLGADDGVHIGGYDGANRAAGPDAGWLAREVRRRTGINVDAGSQSMLSGFGVRARLARRMVSGRVILIGDAAHEISPIGGQGMSLGWLDALALAVLVPGLLAGNRNGLAAFERNRMRQAARAALQSEINMTLGRPLPGGLLAARNGAIAAVAAVPAANRFVARRFTMQ
ncbi:FAD-dependent monooxygenase [Arthrobacter sp. UKPF54-2]|uniref:FAD-dependent oxidoreductase n=1 Tax=Arthrobacter sp. UKPF54-2 TaxID=2600159 RepID=UPI0011B1A60B|nr:NAD(P)/FAD-dependent oxidoreductase [Arthrobacter sp. UKPF54-2]QDY91095.1 FAD-dependent monooxygenase [Arthrobacter sp. UKPF54-2]